MARVVTDPSVRSPVYYSLCVDLTLRLRDGSTIPMVALVDTGSEVNLVRRNLLPLHHLGPPSPT